MSDYKVIGIDLAKRKLHFAAINLENKIVLKKAMDRKSFFENLSIMFPKSETFVSAKDFAASLGLMPKQNTTGGKIILGRITKQGDRYARTMLIQGARSLLMRSYKKNMPQGKLSEFIERLKEKGKSFNVMAVAIANKLARITYGCLISNSNYQVL